ncbi:hypothetical protein QZH41_019924 [Actinostola sp. cb2023]|nr:hypothetical protein QZH41_019924 [Actinostola sp. cb2023]
MVIKMLIVIVAVNAVLTLPYHVTWLLTVFGHPHSIVKKFCVLLVIATSAAHPIIYGTLNEDFAKGFRSYSKYLQCIRKQATMYSETLRNHSRQTSNFVARSSLSHSSSNPVYCVDRHRKDSLIMAVEEIIMVEEYETCV